ncbi:hypothetical protein Tco_1146150 [Tanacetum coccineum]
MEVMDDDFGKSEIRHDFTSPNTCLSVVNLVLEVFPYQLGIINILLIEQTLQDLNSCFRSLSKPEVFPDTHLLMMDAKEGCEFEHEKEDELVTVMVKVIHELDCMMVVKEIENGILKEVEVSLFGKKVMILEWKETEDGLLKEMEKFGWWFEQDIGGEKEDDNEKDLLMMNEERWMS